MAKNPTIKVKRFSGEVVHEIEVDMPCTERRLERIMLGLLRNMNTDEFFADDSDVARAIEVREGKEGGE